MSEQVKKNKNSLFLESRKGHDSLKKTKSNITELIQDSSNDRAISKEQLPEQYVLD